MNDSENLSRSFDTGWRYTETSAAEEAESALLRWPRLHEALQQRRASTPEHPESHG